MKAYETIIMDKAKAQDGRRISLWQAECAIRAERGRMIHDRLATALRRLLAAGRLELEREGQNKAMVWYRVPAGRR